MAYFCVIWHCTADDSRCCSSSSVVRDIRRRCQLWFFWLARPLDIYVVKGEVYVARRRGHCSYLTRLVGFGNNNEDDITAPSQQKSSWFQQTAKNQGGCPVTPQAGQLRLGPGLRFLHPQSPAPCAKLASSRRLWMAACNCRSDEKRWARRRASGLTTHCGAVLRASPPTPHSLLVTAAVYGNNTLATMQAGQRRHPASRGVLCAINTDRHAKCQRARGR